MKFKYCFTFTVILIILFSLTTVVASENVTVDDCLVVDDVIVELDENHESENEISSDIESGADLSVKFYGENKQIWDAVTVIDVPCTVVAYLSSGIACNTKVQLAYDFDEVFQYSSYNVTMGTYDPTTKLWDVGDLSSSDNASLTIFTKFVPNGKFFSFACFFLTANATSDSYDVDLSNNYQLGIFNLSAGNVYIEDSDGKEGPQHSNHEHSESSSSFIELIDDGGSSEDNLYSDSSDAQSNSQSNQNTNSNSNEIVNYNSDNGLSFNSNIVLKEINQQNVLTTAISLTQDSLENSISEIFNFNPVPAHKHSDKSLNSVGAIHAYDYTRIPILIFILFAVILIVIVGYDKVKS